METGADRAILLRYDPRWIKAVPPQVIDRFAGVGNPLSICMPQSGDVVLDVGCGSGFDTCIAILKGATAFGVDPTASLLRPGLVAGRAEALPFDDASFDMVISNDALGLIADYREIFRVLRPEGTLAVAELRADELLPKLTAAGFSNVRNLGPTGYSTAQHITARK